MTPELEMQVMQWRAKAAQNKLTPEEMTDAIRIVRDGRMSAAASSTTAKKAAAKAVVVDADQLLDDWMK